MNLSGKLLIAMPGMGDPRFEYSVVFLCAHSEDGAMGLIVNKPAGGLRGISRRTFLALSIRNFRLFFIGPTTDMSPHRMFHS